MKVLKTITKGIDKANDYLGRVFSTFTLVTLVVIICEVILRRIFNKPQIWTNDMICMSFACYVILISAFGLLKKSYVCVDVLYTRLKPVAQHILHVVTYFIFFVPFAFKMLPVSWRFFLKAYTIGEKGYSVWQPPTWPVKLCLFIGLLLLCIQGVSEILKHIDWVISYYRNGKKEPEEETAPSLLETLLGEDAAAEMLEEMNSALKDVPENTDGKEEV